MKAKNGNAFPPTHAADISTHNKQTAFLFLGKHFYAGPILTSCM